MPKPCAFELRLSLNAISLGALLVFGCSSSASDPSSPAAVAGASASNNAGAGPSAGASSVPGAGANSSAGATGGAGAATGGAPGAAGGAPPASAGAAGSLSLGGSAGAGSVAASDLWIAPDGYDTNAGTEAKPLLNLPYALAKLSAGFTVWIKAGTYKYTTSIALKKAGTEAKPFTIAAAAGARPNVVLIDGCWAFSNGKGVNGNNPAGDGNGFKLGGKPTSVGEGGAVHLVKGSFAFENLTCGYTQNSNPDVPKLSGCGAKDNKDDYCQTLSQSGEVSMTMSAAQAKAAKRNADGSLPAMK